MSPFLRLIAQMHILGAWYRCTCAISHDISTSCDMLFCLVYLSLSLSLSLLTGCVLYSAVWECPVPQWVTALWLLATSQPIPPQNLQQAQISIGQKVRSDRFVGEQLKM